MASLNDWLSRYTLLVSAPARGKEPVSHRLRDGFLLARVGQDAWSFLEGVLEPFGLRPRHLVVLMELRDRGATSQGTLLEALRFDAATLVSLLNHLEGQGLLVRRRDPDDRRRHIVNATAKGKRRLQQADEAITLAEDELLGALTPEQRDQFAQALRALEQAGWGGPSRRARPATPSPRAAPGSAS